MITYEKIILSDKSMSVFYVNLYDWGLKMADEGVGMGSYLRFFGRNFAS